MASNFPLISKHLWQDQLCLPKLILQSPIFLSISLLLISFLLILFTYNTMNNKRSSSSLGVKELNLPPSPPRLPVIGNLHQLGKFPHRSLRALSKEYGPLMLLRLGQAAPTLVVSSPDLVKEIAKNHDVIFSNRPQSTASDVLLYGGIDMAFSPYGEYWRQTQRICAVQLLSLKRVQSFQSVREEEVKRLVDRLRKASPNIGDSENSINLSEILISTSNNIVSRCILGENYDTEKGGGSRLGELGRRLAVQFLAFSVADYFPSLRWIDMILRKLARLPIKESDGEEVLKLWDLTADPDENGATTNSWDLEQEVHSEGKDVKYILGFDSNSGDIIFVCINNYSWRYNIEEDKLQKIGQFPAPLEQCPLISEVANLLHVFHLLHPWLPTPVAAELPSIS